MLHARTDLRVSVSKADHRLRMAVRGGSSNVASGQIHPHRVVVAEFGSLRASPGQPAPGVCSRQATVEWSLGP